MKYTFQIGTTVNLGPQDANGTIAVVTGVPASGIQRVYVEFQTINCSNPASGFTYYLEILNTPQILLFDGTHGSSFTNNNITIDLYQSGAKQQPGPLTPWVNGTYVAAASGLDLVSSINNGVINPNQGWYFTTTSGSSSVSILKATLVFETISNTSCTGSQISVSSFDFSKTTYTGADATLRSCFLADKTQTAIALQKLTDDDPVTGWGVYGTANANDMAYVTFDLGSSYDVTSIEIGPSSTTCVAPNITKTNYLNNATVLYSTDNVTYKQAVIPSTSTQFLFTNTSPGIYACYAFSFTARYVRIRSIAETNAFLGISRFKIFGSATPTTTTVTTTATTTATTTVTTTVTTVGPPPQPIHAYDFKNRLLDVNTVYPVGYTNGPIDLADNNAAIDDDYTPRIAQIYVAGRITSGTGALRFTAPTAGFSNTNYGHEYNAIGTNLNVRTITFWLRFSTGSWADGPTGPFGTYLKVNPRDILQLRDITSIHSNQSSFLLFVQGGLLKASSTISGATVLTQTIVSFSALNQPNGVCFQQWYFITCTFSTLSTCVVQVWRQNGSMLAEVSVNLAANLNAQQLKLGGYFATNGYYGAVSHDISDLRIFPTALNSTQIASIYNNGYGTSLSVSTPDAWRCPKHLLPLSADLSDSGSSNGADVLITAPTNLAFQYNVAGSPLKQAVISNGTVNSINVNEVTRGSVISWNGPAAAQLVMVTDWMVSFWCKFGSSTTTNQTFARLLLRSGVADLLLLKLYRNDTALFLDYVDSVGHIATATAATPPANIVKPGSGFPMTTLCHYAIRYSYNAKSLTVYGNGVPMITVAAYMTVSSDWATINGTFQLGSNTALVSDSLMYNDLRILVSDASNFYSLNNISGLNIEQIFNNNVVNTLGCQPPTTTTVTTTVTTSPPIVIPYAIHFYPLAGDTGDRVGAGLIEPADTNDGLRGGFYAALDLITNVDGKLNYTQRGDGQLAVQLALTPTNQYGDHVLRVWGQNPLSLRGGSDPGRDYRITIQGWFKFNCVKNNWHVDNIISFATDPLDLSKTAAIYYDHSEFSICFSLLDNKYQTVDRRLAYVDVSGAPGFQINTWYLFNVCVYNDTVNGINKDYVAIDIYGGPPGTAPGQAGTLSISRTFTFTPGLFTATGVKYLAIGGDGSWITNVSRSITGLQTMMVSDLAIYNQLLFGAKAKFVYNYGNKLPWTEAPLMSGGFVECPAHRMSFDNNVLDSSTASLHTPLLMNSYGDINFASGLIGDGIIYNSVVDPAGYLQAVTSYDNMIGSAWTFSISVWFKDTLFKTANYATTKSNAVIELAQLNSAKDKKAIAFVTQEQPGLSQQLSFNNLTPNRIAAYKSPIPTVGAWNHLVISHNRWNNRYTFYLNGQACGEQQAQFDPSYLDMVLTIGGSTNWFFEELRIYDFLLSSTQVATLYSGGTGYSYLMCHPGGPTTTAPPTTTPPPSYTIPAFYYPLTVDTYDYFRDCDLGVGSTDFGTFQTFGGITGFTPPAAGAQFACQVARASGFLNGSELAFTVFLRPPTSATEVALITLQGSTAYGATQTLEFRVKAPGTLKISWAGVVSGILNVTIPANTWSFLTFKRAASGLTAVSLNNGNWYNGPIVLPNETIYFSSLQLANATFADLRFFAQVDINYGAIYNGGTPKPITDFSWSYNYKNPIHHWKLDGATTDKIYALNLTAGTSTSYVAGAPKLGGQSLRIGGSPTYDANYSASTGSVQSGIITNPGGQGDSAYAFWVDWGFTEVTAVTAYEGSITSHENATVAYFKISVSFTVTSAVLTLTTTTRLGVPVSNVIYSTALTNIPRWTHVAVRYNSNSGSWFAYIDAVCTLAIAVDRGLPVNAQTLYLGSSTPAAEMPQASFNDYRIYQYLRGQDVAKLFLGTYESNAPTFPPTTNQAHHYRFNNTTFDSWSNQDLTPVSSGAYGVTYVSRTFDGISQVCGIQFQASNSEYAWYKVSSDGSWLNPGLLSFTIAGWFRIDAAPPISQATGTILYLKSQFAAVNDLKISYDQQYVYFNDVKILDGWAPSQWTFFSLKRLEHAIQIRINESSTYTVYIANNNRIMTFGDFILGNSPTDEYGNISVSDIVVYNANVDLASYYNLGIGTFSDDWGEEALLWFCGPHQYKLNSSGEDSNGYLPLTVGSGTSYAAGKINNALTVNNNAAYDATKRAVAVGIEGSPCNTTGNNFSVAFWAKWLDSSAFGGVYLTIYSSVAGVSKPTISLMTDDASATTPAWQVTNSSNAVTTLDVLGTQTSDTWAHYVLTYNNGNYTAYLNGVVVGSYGVTRSTVNPDTIVLGAAAGAMPTIAFDDVRTFSATLTGWDVAELYNSGNGTEISCNGTTTSTTPAPTTAPPPIPLTYLSHYWKFGQNTFDNRAVKNSTGGQDWLPSGVITYETGKLNYAATTNAGDFSALVYDCNYFSLLAQSAYSWAMWIRVNSDANGTILSNEGSLDLDINYVQNGTEFDLRFGPDTVRAGLQYDIWYSLIISTQYSSNTITVSIYVNNEAPVSFTVSSATYTLGSVFIGRSLDLTSYSSISISELRFYDTFLTAANAASYFYFGYGYAIPCDETTTNL
jgi:hypothetical protein